MELKNKSKEIVKRAILLGYSGHGYVVMEAALLSGIDVIGYAEKREVLFNPYSLQYFGDERLENFRYWAVNKNFILGVGDNHIRMKVAKRVIDHGANCISIIHADASMSKLASLGSGTFVARNASINPFTEIGNYVILNTSSSIDHECRIEDGVHIGPGAVLAGQVFVGSKAFIGANSVVKEGVSIGANAIIGAGSVVIRDVQENEKVVGNPARTFQ